MKAPTIVLGIVFLVLSSCSSDDSTSTETPLIDEEVEVFLEEVLDLMQNNSINRNDINWSEFRNQVRARASDAQSLTQIEPALILALQLLGDNHSSILKENGDRISASTANCESVELETVSVPENIGYLRVPFYSNGTSQENTNFAVDLQNQIREQDNAGLNGWIVDLRGNTGGNMWPMLAGVGPILGEGTVGYFIGPDNSDLSWSYNNGASVLGQNAIVRVPPVYELINPDPKVAVLLDNGVRSSGEAIAIAFIGRENTRSFGMATCGLSTANRGFPLSDGSVLLLTTDYMADRDRNLYGFPIEPEVEASNDNIIELAIDYIENQ